MPDDIPPIDPDLIHDGSSQYAGREELEFELLEAEASLKRLAHRELGQRYIIKWVAVSTGVIVILGMSGALWHMVHSVIWGPFVFANAAFSVAMIVAPITSITAITVALFVGAFRKFEEKDLEVVGSGVAGAANFMRGD
ncbi:MAG: hypothetical protein COB29_09945 [Sulfitobacter sp.]|jgi:hypothetical protein|nr:hypothetical protein [Roseobacter sp.]MBV50512.1 hypothetical protein [Roseobacter sp.]PHR06677.1 MAG: hypothetical protein COB29_09945 [Sulfitobacter sp.]|tara:strand:+ start:712 stop:1128 length:417 start_codon:yes stop_codon:yes gene_type:complete